MAQYNVVPVGAGSSRWRLERNGTPISRHNTQATAIKRARSKGRSGDRLVIHDRNGQIRDNTTLQ